MVMSDAERQRKRRAKLKQMGKKVLHVRGTAGEFDERIRTALAVRELAIEGAIPKDLVKLIASRAEIVFPTEELSTRKFINQIVTDYLTKEDS